MFIMKSKLFFLAILIVTLSGCVGRPTLKPASQLQAPTPIYGNTGKFMSPYTEDGVLAEWVDNAMKAKAGAQIGSAVGAYAGSKLLEQIPFVGGILGQKVGNKIGREIAIKSAGGMEFITENSDMSFNDLNNLSVYIYVKHSKHEHFKDALGAAQAIYPDLKQVYYQALIRASR